MTTIDLSTRRFLQTTVAVGTAVACAALTGNAFAQGKPPVQGTDYTLIDPKQPTDSGGKIEVIEFFWLGCPHCAALEPVLEDWVRKLPSDVTFHRVHVPFNEIRHQQLYYTISALGRGEELVPKVFNAIQVEHNLLNTPDKISAFLAKNGVDAKTFNDTWNSFGVQTSMRKATATAAAYKVDSVPQIAINGKYVTAPSMAGSSGNALTVADTLIDRERKASK